MNTHRTRTAAVALFTLIGSIAGLGITAPSASAAVYVGWFNRATCNPTNHTIFHSMEVYRSAGETVYLRSILVNSGGGSSIGAWQYGGNSGTAKATYNWTGASGRFSVYMQYAVWNPRTQQYVYLTVQLTGSQLETYGRYIGNYTYAGGGNGYCNA